MATASLTIRDILLPFVGAVAGYAVGILQTVAADRRDRSKARNTLLYLLFQLLQEVRSSNPRLCLPLMTEVLAKRFGATPDATVPRGNLTKLLASALQNFTGKRLLALSESYERAVQALVPTDPMLALSLRGARVTGLEQFVRDYYKLVHAHPEVAGDPNAPRVIATMEEHALEMAFDTAVEGLVSDIRAVATSCRPLRRRHILRLLGKQNRPLSAKQFEAEVGGFLDEMEIRIKTAMIPGSLTK